MKHGGLWNPFVAGPLSGALLFLLGCGSSGNGAGADSGLAPGDASLDRDGAVADAASPGDAEGGEAATEAGHDATLTDGAGLDGQSDADGGSQDATGAEGGEGGGYGDGGYDGEAGNGALTFSIDMSKGPARQFQPPALPAPIYPYIYGINGLGTFVQQKTRWGLIRKGGGKYSAWNWTNNYQNAGSSDCFWQGQADGGAGLAAAIVSDTDTLPAAQAAGEAYLATVPIGDHVASAFDNDTNANNLCPFTSNCTGAPVQTTGVNSNNLDFVSVNPASPAFVPNAASKPGAFCSCAPSQPCDGGCSVSTNPVYQDEFVNYIRTNFGGGGSSVFFELDNEPNYWGGVHPELWPFTGVPPCQTSSVTYDDILSRDEQFAAAIKKAWPSTKVFGPVVAQDGLIYAHSYDKDPHYPVEFLDYYLGGMSKASASAATSLLDVLDVHYYNFQASTPSQCVQNPRMFWDPNFTETSASDTDSIDFAYSGLNNYFDTAWYPRRLIPRLFDKITMAYPAGGPQAPGLSFSEYNSGCEDVIAGAITEADDLGIFGREGVFAAAASPVLSLTNNYLVAAFDLYRNYDGNGTAVGDTAVAATTSDVEGSSVYAFAHSGDASLVDVVAINKTSAPVAANLSIASAPQLKTATLYNIVNGAAAVVPVGTPPPVVTCTAGACSLAYTMPALSATTIVLR